jgi:uncharacterized circularly permuted ATP-grasp superfamily protein
MFGDRPVSMTLRPQLIGAARYQAAVDASQSVYAALGRLERALLLDRRLRSELDLDPEEERLALIDHGGASSSPSARIDGFLTDRLRFVEYNAESPAGMAYGDTLTAVFERLPVMRAFRKRFRIRSLPTRARQLAAMLRSFRRWGKERTPVIAIVDWTGLPTTAEFELFRDYFSSRGVRTVICEPRSLEFGGGRLHACGVSVNLVYRRVLTSELLARRDEGRALLEAYAAGSVCVVNSFRAKLLHKKMSLALLSDDRYAPLYTPRQRQAIARHVPWTRKVRQGATTRAGVRIPDLAAYVAGHREELVLKPNDEYGGKGVVLGWVTSQTEWERALANALAQPFVVQEKVSIPRETYPMMLEGMRFLELAVDMDPYLFDGRASGCLTRLSSSALLNVTAGAGSVAPAYVVEGAA